MLTEDLLKKAQQANIKLYISIQGFQDSAILAALESLFSIINESLEHIQKLLTQGALLENTLQNEMSHIRKLIESKIEIIEAKGTQFLEKIEAVELLGGVCNSYLTLYEYYYPQPKQASIARWQDDRLRLEQQVICKEKDINEELKNTLTALSKIAERYFSVPNRCFISYAWAGDISPNERWVQPFLKHLETHLSQAGVNVSLDIKDNLMGNNFYQYMNRFKQSDCVIVVGTQALFQQHETGIGKVCNELILVNENRAQRQGKTLPILLSGCLDNALPPYFQMYNRVTDWRESSYITNLKKLLASIYDVEVENIEYQQLWKEFEQSYPILVTGFPEETIHGQIALENTLASQQKELDAQQAIALFKRVNESQLNQLKMSNLCLTDNITWEILIKCVKAKYMEGDQFKTVFGEVQEISHCYVNLAIVEEKEQREKEKLLAEEMYNQDTQKDEQLSENKKLSKQELKQETWLSSYEKIHGKKMSILLQDIFKLQDKKEQKCQLILGRAGIGKSTLCQYLAYQWAKEEWWKDEPFKLLVWVPLRQLINESIYPTKGNALTLGKLFYEQYKQQLSEYLLNGEEKDWVHLVDKLIKEHSSEILYVLDGFDEVAHVCQLDARHATRQTEILSQLLKQERVVVTSRPYYIDNYLNTQGLKIDRRLENIGFVECDIQNYIQRYFQEQPELKTTLQSLLKSNHLMRGIAHIPINLALLCRYWSKQTVKKDHYLTMTDLYKGLVSDLLYEYLGKGYINFKGESRKEVLESAEVQPILGFLEKLAFLQMQEDSLFISQERICALSKELKTNQEKSGFEKVLDAGLLVSPDSQEKCFEQKREHCFIHLTFQEFLAACYIARVFKQDASSARTVVWLERSHQDRKISSRPLVLFIQNYKYDLRYEIVWWFVAGLLKDHKEGIERFFNSLFSEFRSLSGWYDALLWIKCLEENQLTNNLNERLKKDLMGKIKNLALAALDSKACISKYKYSKTFFEYLYSSPMIFEKLGILQTQKAVREALNILQQHSNFPLSIVENIVSLLSDKNKDVKSSAQSILKKQPNLSDNILNEIVKLLRNKNWDVRSSVRSILKKQPNLSRDVLNEIVNLLRNKNKYTRGAALEVLGQQPNLSDGALNEIVRLLRDKNWNVRRSALSALVQQPNLSDSVLHEIVELLSDKNCVDSSSAALSALAQQPNLSANALNKVVKLLRNRSLCFQGPPLSVGKHKQPNLSDSELNEMVKLLSDKEEEVRHSALKALGQQPNLPISVLEEMVKLLSDKNWNVRSATLDALGQQRNLSDSVVNEMVRLLSDENEDLQSSALEALGQQPNLPTSVLNEMARLLHNESKYVRSSVLKALGQQLNLGVSVLNEMAKLLRDKSKKVRYSALKALGQQRNLSGSVLNETMKLLRDKSKNMRNLSDSVLHEIVKLLSDESETIRCLALKALGQQPNLSDSVLNEIAKLLSDEQWNVRNSARFALGQQPNLSDSVLNEIVKLLCDKDKDVRSSALNALGQQRNLGVSVLHEMVKLLRDKSKNVKCSALSALGQQQNLLDSILNEIVNLLSDESETVRCLALEALGQQPNLSDSVLHEIARLLSDEQGNVRNSARFVLKKQPNLSDSVLNEIVKLLRDKNWDVIESARLLYQRPNLSDSVVNEIVRLLSNKDKEVRCLALLVLNKQSIFLLDKLNQNQNSQTYEEEINFINQQLAQMPDNQVLQSQPFLNSRLLSNVILENTFLGKNVAYFKNDQSIIIRLGLQYKQIEIKDKNEFISVFIEQYKLWINNQEPDYLLKRFECMTIA